MSRQKFYCCYEQKTGFGSTAKHSDLKAESFNPKKSLEIKNT